MKLKVLLPLLWIGLSLQSQVITQKLKALPSKRATNDFTGYSVAISGKYAIAGAYGNSEDAHDSDFISFSGAAFIYEMDNSGNWVRKQKLVASDRAEDDAFGYDVAISGDYAVVGTYSEDEDANGGNTISDAGSAYVFERNGSGVWVQVQKIVASDRSVDDAFGTSVAISGGYIVVGAQAEDHNATGGAPLTDAGSAYMFERNGSGVWVQVKKIVAVDRGAGDYFGNDVSISGNIAVIGAYNEDQDGTGGNTKSNSGSAYVFERTGGLWAQAGKLIASDRDVDDLFGTSVGVSGPYVIIGARVEDQDENGANTLTNSGSAYFFEKKSGIWTQVQKIVSGNREAYGIFGIVGISGKMAVVGAYGESKDVNGNNSISKAGAAYLFERDDNTGLWNLAGKMVAQHRGVDNTFGADVGISGNYIIAGSPYDYFDDKGKDSIDGAGASYIFKVCKPNASGITPIACRFYISPSGKRMDSTIIFKDTISNVNGCDSVIQVDLTILKSDRKVNQNNENLSSAEAAATYQWVDCGNNYSVINGATQKSYKATKNGMFAVVLYKGACADTSACVTVSNLSVNSSYLNTLKISPNPVKSSFELINTDAIVFEAIKILDASGRMVKTFIPENANSLVFDCSDFTAGVYLIEAYSGTSVYHIRFVKE